MLRQLGATEILIIIAVALLLFGARRLPDMARSLGKSARILKNEAHTLKTHNPPEAHATHRGASPEDSGDAPSSRNAPNGSDAQSIASASR
ncbi:Sec-independent protein translocase protein TatA [Streptomyces spiroverticillatus]|uniref:Sec-independent protein translocase protein TatA n=1 Tax=Streptomyces finlayi TaxID=67296 RepID=A0A919CE90_9ACTN|nr:Sec-independent protein translocase subunit TatA [Streptomyces finlayi]GHA42999.1 Sec-independent protein translocase protein TatA [Streptomyces spiroverticillatus]GHD13980.1 Sec-independent protein translocase protein TatA [Streptomyces finlayi]